MAPDTVENSETQEAQVDGAEPSAQEGLRVDDLGKSFKGRPVLRSVSLSVHRGEAVGLLELYRLSAEHACK